MRSLQTEKHVEFTKSIMGNTISYGEYYEKKENLLNSVKNDKSQLCDFDQDLLYRSLNEGNLFSFSSILVSIYNVTAKRKTYKVEIYMNLSNCTCKFIHQMKFPCVHILIVCESKGLDYYQYISEVYSKYYYYLTEYVYIDYSEVLKTEINNKFEASNSNVGAKKRKRFENKKYLTNKCHLSSKVRPDNDEFHSDKESIISQTQSADVSSFVCINCK